MPPTTAQNCHFGRSAGAPLAFAARLGSAGGVATAPLLPFGSLAFFAFFALLARRPRFPAADMEATRTLRPSS